MKTLHITFSFPPDAPAGTEIYVAALCRGLAGRGIESVVAAPADANASYRVDGIEVRRVAMSAVSPSLRELYGGADSAVAARFEQLLDEERPDLVHQHALTFACSTELMCAAKRRGLPLVFTYHTPTTSCQRGTLLEYGDEVCDGRLEESRCTSCTLHGLGVPRTLSRMLAAAPLPITRWLGTRVATGPASTALRIPDAMRARIRLLRRFLTLPDRFVALTPWVRDLLVVNGVASDRITLSRHGLGRSLAHGSERRPGPLRIAHLGRLDPVKGTDLLVSAVRAVSAPVRLDIFGVLQKPDDARRLRTLRESTGDDARIRFLPTLEPKAVIDALAAYDVLAVPSQWLETGPLVVLEAFAAGIPVIGSDLGGIADKVRNGVDGVLVTPHASIDAWRAAIEGLARDVEFVEMLKRGVRPPRPLADVVEEMRDLYISLVPASGESLMAAV